MAKTSFICLAVLLLVGVQLAASIPAYSSYGPNYAASGPGYAASGSYSGTPFNNIPSYSAYSPPVDFTAMFQQYFAALQAQQQAFQAQLQAQINAQQQAIWDQSNRVDGNLNGIGGTVSNEPAIATASGSIGPQGGYQAASISPAAPGIFSRFGESVPAPSGGSYGVFSSSSSSSQTGPDGKTVSRKTATVGVNDNGKVSIKTVHDP